ncbi:hypothetical protein J22TS1_26500 [Siminovitchia terrae]|uniref:glycoside hydrolase domain-containing protein n=1 Tax=Siminovitchia terrae TaxID=1914933 RepID=UPI001B20804D|nr:glycoside hydrolase domain-containing protein [Siminovitchia terrae]GIN91599.1 hypothetical protein J22TS1_26500 [Siminovitchia terrae]
MDPAVMAAQVWVNSMYGGRQGYVAAPETGKTGWSTVYSLTRALQLELGITNTADSFGETTARKYNEFGILEQGKVPDTEQGRNIVKILQCAMYCKGYNPGGITGMFGDTMKNYIIKLQTDAGLPVRDGRVYDYIFKAFLTMDAYVRTSGGDTKVREIQRDLNNKYFRTSGVQPCDGHYQRGTNKALIYGLQTEIGIPASQQTGSVGPGTRAGLPTLREGSTGQFVKLFQYALYFNGYDASPFNGTYSSQVKYQVAEFQRFVKLIPTGTADLTTWLSTLVSTGDPNRKGQACDGITEVTPARAQTLINNGYKTIGRYLVNVPGGLNKKIQPGELATIFDAGLSVFPIYQTYGSRASYFNYEQGIEDGIAAFNAAREYGFKKDTTIYFAVDFDAYGSDITDNIIPYFRGVNSQFIRLGSPYKIGVYGARNVCIQVSRGGLAHNSFVSGMSTGFSGNLGFPLPSNWAFDQISTITIGSGSGSINIDNNIMSERDPGQTSVGGNLIDLNVEAFNELKRIFDLAMEYTGDAIQQANYLVTNYYRKERYAGGIWTYTTGGIVKEFKDFVNTNYKDVKEFKNFIDPKSRHFVDTEHLMATLSSILYTPDIPFVGVHVKGLAGWAGDLFTSMIEVYEIRENESYDATYAAGLKVIGARDIDSHFSYDDYLSDIDALNIGKQLDGDITLSIYDAFVDHFRGNGVMTRIADFFETKFKSSKANAEDDAVVYLNSVANVDIAFARAMLRSPELPVPHYTDEEGRALAKAWADKLYTDVLNE